MFVFRFFFFFFDKLWCCYMNFLVMIFFFFCVCVDVVFDLDSSRNWDFNLGKLLAEQNEGVLHFI